MVQSYWSEGPVRRENFAKNEYSFGWTLRIMKEMLGKQVIGWFLL